MMLARCAALGLPLVLAALSGCAHHREATASTELRPSETGGFSRIDMRGSVDVLVREGPVAQVAITGGPDDRAHVQTHVVGDTLVIESAEGDGHGDDGDDDDDDDSTCSHSDAKVTVDVPALRSAILRGSGDLVIQAAGSHPEVDLVVLGQGDVRYTGSADLVRCKIDGSGDVELRGAGKRLEASLHGSGDLNARDFPVEGGAYEIEGSGDIATVVHGGEMAVHIGGSGDLRYRGDARITSLAVTGDGAVRQLDSSDD
ncbi:MAG TPA: head GIN domain-containing protein [Polyangiaceae bacterium]|nr:head GIN domain-containing protein [Polyangiaceae bacterium]